ncbi:High-affinity heme uptake system protein IsdE precursor [Sporomusa ovata DSM 2662]|uniref:Iron compound ABC transporter, iron compound-binding protein n=1 Tax=Sporomusa ovata TaxID=2378 RepID=A0A0U1KZE8_9FIRM|nr:ABC transporter substrate-binding protein [Sporomusa ovata]EQB27823.1 ABC-type transporter, periplasmic subunit [Sporomusa ovata DSM 2662]CQR72756.1 iron compound ABC transporter, iron compound-binding protein [Sporomusa ovata]
MVHKLIGGFIVFFLLAGSFLVFGQESRGELKSGSFKTVIDGAGRRIVVPEQPQRVVALNASNIDLYLGAGGKLTGRAATNTLPPAVRAAVKDVPTVGLPPNPNLEQLVALKPDLVLAANIPFHHVLVPVLEKAGIPILLQTLDSYQQVLDTLAFYGELTGQPDKAAAEIARIENRYKAATVSANGKPAPRVLILWGTTESFNMGLSSSFTGDLVKRLGGVNVAEAAEHTAAAGGYAPLSLEFVVKARPEVILYITHSSDEKVETKFRSELARQPAWQGIEAVRQNRVYKLPYHLFAVNPGTQVGEAVAVLAGLLYPDSRE